RMHLRRLVPLDEVGMIAAAAQELLQLLATDACRDGRVGDLIAIEVQNRQNGPVASRIEELVAVPPGRERSGLRLAIADNAGNQEIRVVEDGAVSMTERVAQLASFMDGTGRFRRHMAGNAAGKGELLEEPLQSWFILCHVGIQLAV